MHICEKEKCQKKRMEKRNLFKNKFRFTEKIFSLRKIIKNEIFMNSIPVEIERFFDKGKRRQNDLKGLYITNTNSLTLNYSNFSTKKMDKFFFYCKIFVIRHNYFLVIHWQFLRFLLRLYLFKNQILIHRNTLNNNDI